MVSSSRAARVSIVTTLLTALALGTSACGGGDETSTTARNDDSTATKTEGTFPATVEHKFGTTTVPEKPTRVVSIGYKEQDWLYEFGVSPVAVRKWYGAYDNEINPWAADLVEGEPPKVLDGELSVEQVAALKPDLIVAVYSGITKKEYAQYSKIAPVVAGPVGSTDYQEPWRDITRLIGGALGQPERADELIEEIEGLFAEVKKEHPELVGAEVATSAAWSADSLGMYTSADARPTFLAELGLVSPPEIDDLSEDGSFWVPVSPELIGKTYDLADDAVVVLGATVEEDETGAGPTLEQAATFGTSRVAQEGRVILLDTVASDVAFSFGSPLSIRFTLDHLVPQLVAAIDGDPATDVPASPDVP